MSSDYYQSKEFAEKVTRKAWDLAAKIDPYVRDVIAHCLHDPYIERIEYVRFPAWRASGITVVLGWRISGGLLPPGDPYLSVFGTRGSPIYDRLCELLYERTRIPVFDEDRIKKEESK
jgi:hypothetical protein